MLSNVHTAVDAVYRADWGRIVATLIRSFGDFDLSEEAAQEAFTAAVNQWRTEGVPDSSAAWIIQTAKHKAIDRIRRRRRFDEKVEEYANELPVTTERPEYAPEEIPDDRLRLIFTCCHPALSLEVQVASDAAHVVRARDGRDRARVSGSDDDDGSAVGPSETKDSRCRHSL